MRVIKHWHMLPRELGVSIFGDTENLTGHSPEQPAPGDIALSNWF